MLSRERALARINEMPIEELTSIFVKALDDSHIEYELGRGTIVWDGLPVPEDDNSSYVKVPVPAKRSLPRNYMRTPCALENTRAVPIPGHSGTTGTGATLTAA